MEESLENLIWPDDLNYGGFTSCFCGDTVFIYSPRKRGKVTLIEMSMIDQSLTEYEVLERFPNGELIMMYTLHSDGVLGLIFWSRNCQLAQYVYKLNKDSLIADCMIRRTLTFGMEHAWSMSVDVVNTGYVILFGKSEIETYTLKLIAANPFQIKKFPDYNFDKEISELIQLCERHPNKFNVFFTCPPMITNHGLYFFLGCEKDINGVERNYADFTYLGCIKKVNGHYLADIVTVDFENAKESVEKAWDVSDLNIHTLFVVQRSSVAWIMFLGINGSKHWIRMLMQSIAEKICLLCHRYIGRPLLWFKRWDGGFLIRLYLRIYDAIVGPSGVPQFYPNPDLFILALDLDMLEFRHVPYQITKKEQLTFRTIPFGISMDALPDGSLMLNENSLKLGKMKFTRFSNPFKVSSLVKLAFLLCQEVMPYSCENVHFPSVRKFGGCNIFV